AGANVSVIGDPAGGLSVDDDVIIIAREGGRDLLGSLNLRLNGRFIDIGRSVRLAELANGGDSDLLGLLDQRAQDLFWSEERPLTEWSRRCRRVSRAASSSSTPTCAGGPLSCPSSPGPTAAASHPSRACSPTTGRTR